jgi:TolB protein
MKRLLALCLATLAVSATLPAVPAAAAFPGRNGRIVFQRWDAVSSISDVFTIKPSAAGLTQLTASPAVEDQQPAWSADGDRIALRRVGGGVDGLWVMNADGTGLAMVPGTGLDRSPAWSPDGGSLVYECYAGPAVPADICRRDVGGGGFVPLTATALEETAPVWSPDGTRVVFGRETAVGGSQLVVLDLATMVETPVTAAVAGRYDGSPDWSPDGTQLVFTRFVAGSGVGGGVFRVKVATGAVRPLSVPAAGLDVHHTHPVWSPDGRYVAYAVVDDDGAFGHVFTMTATGLGTTQLTFGPVTDLFPDWQPG